MSFLIKCDVFIQKKKKTPVEDLMILLICQLSSSGLRVKSYKGCEGDVSFKSLKDGNAFAPELLHCSYFTLFFLEINKRYDPYHICM